MLLACARFSDITVTSASTDGLCNLGYGEITSQKVIASQKVAENLSIAAMARVLALDEGAQSDDEDCKITAVTHVSDPVASLDLCQVCGGHSLSCFACRLRCTARRRFPLSSINDRSKRTRTMSLTAMTCSSPVICGEVCPANGFHIVRRWMRVV